MPGDRCLAAAQTVPIVGNIDRNVADHIRVVEVAGRAGAEVVVFPELSLTGYVLESVRDLAISPSDPRLDPLVESASDAGLTIVAGAPLLIAETIHIGAIILAPTGAREVYTKHYLGHGEERFVTPGVLDPIVSLGTHRGAVCVCADANQPAHSEAAAARGADTYLVSSLIVAEEFDRKTAALQDYARSFEMTVVFANYGGTAGDLVGAGGSTVWSARGDVVVRALGADTALAVATMTDDVWSGHTLPFEPLC